MPGENFLNIEDVLKKDVWSISRTMCLTGVAKFVDDVVLDIIAGSLSPGLQNLNLSFAGCGEITDTGVSALANAIPP